MVPTWQESYGQGFGCCDILILLHFSRDRWVCCLSSRASSAMTATKNRNSLARPMMSALLVTALSRQSRRHICSPRCEPWERMRYARNRRRRWHIGRGIMPPSSTAPYDIHGYPHLAMWATNMAPSSTVVIGRSSLRSVFRPFFGQGCPRFRLYLRAAVRRWRAVTFTVSRRLRSMRPPWISGTMKRTVLGTRMLKWPRNGPARMR
jgi:hypothetical protein